MDCIVALVEQRTHRYMAAMLRLIQGCILSQYAQWIGLYPLQNSQ